MFPPVTDLHFFKYFSHAFFTLGSRHTEIYQWELYIFLNIELIDQVKTLENEANILLPELGTIAFILTGFIVLIIQRKIARVVLPIKNINDNLYQNLKRVIENVILIRLFNIEKIEIEHF